MSLESYTRARFSGSDNVAFTMVLLHQSDEDDDDDDDDDDEDDDEVGGDF